jgi:O-antigen/teichoic acid export membrane protein
MINKRILHGVLSGIGLTIILIVVAFIQLRLILDFLPSNMAGIWLLFLSLGTYIAFFDLGISPTLSREISFILGANDSAGLAHNQRIADLLSTSLRLFMILASVVFAIGLIAGGYFLSSISPAESWNEIEIAWLIFLLGASINILGGAVFASLYGLGDIATERSIRSITQLLGLGLSYLSLYFGFGITGLAVAWVMQNLLARVIAVIVLYRKHPWLKNVRGNAQKKIVKKIIGPSLKWAATGMGAILILQTDNIIIASILGTAAIPKYEAVAKIAMTLMAFSLLIVTSSSPFLSKSYAAGEKEDVNVMLLRNVRFSVSAIAFLVSFMAIFGDKVITLWLGPGNFAGFPVLWTLLVMVLLEVHHVALATATMATGRIVFVWAALAGGVLNIIISLVLVQHLGLLGVALGTMIAQMLTNNWYAPYVTLVHFEIPILDYMKNTLLPITFTLLASLAFNYFIEFIFRGYTPIVTVMYALFLFTFFSAALFYFYIMTKRERCLILTKLVTLYK